MIVHHAEVCVIGSGAGGAPVAQVLAEAGRDVLVVERGRDIHRAEFAEHDETKTAMEDGVWFPSKDQDPYFQPEYVNGPLVPSSDGKAPQVLGGSTNFWGAYCYRFRPVDFLLVSRYGPIADSTACDWPIHYAQLEPYYARAEKELGVSGKAGADPFAPKSDPASLREPIRIHPFANVLGRTARKLGLHPYQTWQAILQKEDGTRGACLHSGYCGSYGCPTGAKGSARETMLAAAKKTGTCRVLTGLRAAKLIANQNDRGRVTACECLTESGETHRIEAKLFVVACRPIETARLLLCSAQEGHDAGLANSSGLVGRNLMFGMALKAKGYLACDARHDLKEVLEAEEPFCSVSIPDYYEKIEYDGVSNFAKGGTIGFYGAGRSAFAHANDVLYEHLRPNSKPGRLFWGTPLRERLIVLVRNSFQVEFEVFAEYLPNEQSFVRLHEHATDHQGVRCVEVHPYLHEASRKAAVRLAELGEAILFSAGAQYVQRSAPFFNTALSYGTCRAGRDPRRSVLDADCRAHDLRNLFVTDGSWMPTSGGASGTLTIFANAYRVAEHLRAHWADFVPA